MSDIDVKKNPKSDAGDTESLVTCASVTDVGIRKKTNQDSCFVRTAQGASGKSIFAIVCDGVGGLSHGEMASALVTESFAKWYTDEYLVQAIQTEPVAIAKRWNDIIADCNARLFTYSLKESCQTGTTITAILIYDAFHFVAVNIGDSRIYQIRDASYLLTNDNTVTHEAVMRGEMTKEDAAQDKRRHVLTKCIGISQSVKPDFYKGSMAARDLVLLCSDGLYGKLSDVELYQLLSPFRGASAMTMETMLNDIVNIVKNRGEKDNITAVLAKLV